MSCKGLDDQLVRHDNDLDALEKQFVCVRLVQMNGVDLKLFQFDYDLTWAAFFLNADGTIYGRFGTRAGNRGDSTSHVSIAALKTAMSRALELHKGYPANKPQLIGKTGAAPEWPIAQKIPGLTERPARATVRGHDCIHCHEVTENIRRAKWEQRRLTSADIWIWPLPENAGLKLDVDDGLRVKTVASASPAARAGLRPGDELVTLNGQRLISQADIQWVLHTAPVETKLDVAFRRDGAMQRATIALSGDWKESDLMWRGSSWMGFRHGMSTERLGAAEREKLGLKPADIGVRVRDLHPRGAPLRTAGLQKGDVFLSVDGKGGMTESQFIAHVRLNHPPGDKWRALVLRGDKRVALELPAW